ncbi:MAG TPA: RDD family protein [Chryseosolibacter sp.]|nr:RDD family protein [Chryseosolibacter sp.]
METLDTTGSVAPGQSGRNDKSPIELNYDETIFPNLVTRIKALFIDVVVMLAIFTATTIFIDTFGDIPNFVKGSIAIFMFYLYDPILTTYTGSTLGQKIMKLKVRRYQYPEKHISLTQALLRFITKGLLGWVSFLTVTGNKRKRAIHDIVSGSIVMKVR